MSTLKIIALPLGILLLGIGETIPSEPIGLLAQLGAVGVLGWLSFSMMRAFTAELASIRQERADAAKRLAESGVSLAEALTQLRIHCAVKDKSKDE